jgi:hypothetical protein
MAGVAEDDSRLVKEKRNHDFTLESDNVVGIA